jgi:DNA invertase Pin-like site-specific DNA recombinase
MKQIFVAYLRVSTEEQGTSQLGLQAQKRDIENFIERNGGELLETFTEVESGTGRNATNRPILDMAIEMCKETGSTLLIAKIDRLYRSVYFMSKLAQDIEFISVDNPDASSLNRNIMMAFAQEEAEVISKRVVNAMRSINIQIEENGSYVSKAGNTITKLGCEENFTDEGRKAGGESTRRKIKENPNRKMAKLVIKGMKDKFSCPAIAKVLNDEGLKSTRGGKWSVTTVSRLKKEILKEEDDRTRREASQRIDRPIEVETGGLGQRLSPS